jgi:putative FmdB family regulatory protein
MPVYEYRCNDCKGRFEILRPVAEREVAAVCPRCESLASMPLISLVAVGGRDLESTISSAGQDADFSTDVGGCCGGSCNCGN